MRCGRSRSTLVLTGVLILCLGFLNEIPAQDSPASSKDAGFEVTRNSVVIEAPPGLVGRRYVDTSVRRGRLAENHGWQTRHVLTVGSFVKKCPTASGVVEGTFIYELMFDQVVEENGRQKTLHVGHSISATLKGQTGDDALLDHVDIDAALTIERRGTDQDEVVRRSRIQATFHPDRRSGGLPSKISVGSATPWDVPDDSVASGEQGGALFAAALLFTGQTYFAAETGWRMPNACVELKFSPPSMSKSFVSGESTTILTEVHTKEGDNMAPARFILLENPREGNGEVTPKRTETTESPTRITYRAPNTNVSGSGFHADAVSRAGTASGDWLLVNTWTLEFEHRLWHDKTSSLAQTGYSLFEGAVRFTVTLESWAGKFRGEARVHRNLTVSHVTNRCRGSGSQDEDWLVLGEYDATAKVLHLRIDPSPDNEHATWTCDGVTRDLLVASFVRLANNTQVDISVLPGSTQRVTKRQGQTRQPNEELTVTVKTSPVQ